MFNFRSPVYAFFAFLPATTLCGQIGSSTITGRVTDPTGAMVPNASVTVVETETNFSFSPTTNQDGLFRVQSLQPGNYRVTVEATGFKRSVRDNVTLRTGDTLAVNVTLEVGNVADSIEVKESVPLLQTETSSPGTVMQGKTLYSLPIYQRYINATAYLVPGVTMTNPSSGQSLSGIQIAGQRSTSIGVFVDGTTANDPMTGTTTLQPIQSAVAEVNVLTTTLPAEYGHSAGGVITTVSKTGTNQFHGLASAFGRTRRMQHKNFFDVNKTSDPRPFLPNGTPVLFLMPDANGGGPIVIPKLYNGRNKTFFFIAYQKLIDKQTKQFSGVTPSPAMKAGDFSFGGVGAQIYDPFSTTQLPNGTWTRAPIPGNVIPQNRIDPVARKILALNPWEDPSPGFGSFATTGPVSNLIYNQRGQAYFEYYQGRIDHQFTPNVKIYGSYLYFHAAGPGWETNLHNKVFDGTNGNESPSTIQNNSIGTTWIVSPSLINDFRVGYARYRNDKFVPSYGQNWAQTLGIPNVDAALMPAFGSGDQFTPGSIYGLTVSGPSRQIGEALSLRDDLTKIRGTHAYKVGYEVLHFRENSNVTNFPSGQFLFDTMTAGLQANGQPVPNTGNTFAGFEFGAVRQATFDKQLASWLPRDTVSSAYFQDDWKVSQHLTLNLGVRYSNESPFHTKYNAQSNFDTSATDPLTGIKGAIVNPKGNLNRRDRNNFQPRIGFAWHPLTKWVFRGGFAVNTVDVKFPISRGQFDNYVAQAVQQQAPGNPTPLYQLSRGPDPLRFNVSSDGTALFVGTNYSGRNASLWDPNLHNAYVMNWNANIQYQISPNYLLSLMYQGSAGVGLIENWETNAMPVNFGADNPALRAAAFAAPQNYRPFTQFGNISMLSNFGHSTYHAGTVTVDKRYSRGLTFTAFYTFSKTIDSQDTNTSGTGVAPIQNRSLEKARSGWDRTHVAVASATYELPIGNGKRFLNRGGVWDRIFGGYNLAWIQTFQSGIPLTFSFANSPFNYFPTFAGNRRPNVAGTPSMLPNWRHAVYAEKDRYNQAFTAAVIDISHFSYPAAFTPGNAGRNIVTGPGLTYTTFSVQKNIRFRERYTIQARLDMANPFKNWAFSNPSTAVDLLNPQTIGKITSVPQTSPTLGAAPLMNAGIKFFW